MIDPKQEKILRKVAKNWVKCQTEPAFFIENFCMLKDQRYGRAIPFKLWPCQKTQLDIWEGNIRSITLKTRQIGISWLSAAYMLHQMIFRTFFEAMAISRKETDAIKYLDKARFMYHNLPELFKELSPIIHENQRMIELGNDRKKHKSIAMAESSNPEAGRSETLNMIILDEAGFIPDAESIWVAAEPTLEKTDGKAIVISTGNGYDKFFQPIFEGSWETGANGFKANFIPWSGDPSRDQAWYDLREKQSKAQGRLRDFRAEYPRNPVEAFIVSGDTFFDPDLIQEYLNRPPCGFQKGNITAKGPTRFIKNSTGPLKIWEMPQPGKRYVLGADSAEGVESGDNSVIEIYDRGSKDQVAEFAGKLDTDSYANILFRLAHWYNHGMINLEMNSAGDSVLNYLVKHQHYPNIFRQMRYDEFSRKKIKKLGWRTSNSSKRILMDALALFLREREMRPKSLEFFEEMKTFVMIRTDFGNYKLEASGNKKDDRVMATALCSIVFQEQPVAAPFRRRINPAAKSRFLRKKANYDLARIMER